MLACNVIAALTIEPKTQGLISQLLFWQIRLSVKAFACQFKCKTFRLMANWVDSNLRMNDGKLAKFVGSSRNSLLFYHFSFNLFGIPFVRVCICKCWTLFATFNVERSLDIKMKYIHVDREKQFKWWYASPSAGNHVIIGPGEFEYSNMISACTSDPSQ